MPYGLADKTIQAVNRIFAKHEKIKESILYGFCAEGNYSQGSDIDLTLKGEAVNL